LTVASQSGTPTVGQFDLRRRRVCVSSENITTCSSPAGATAVASSKIAYAGGDNTPFGMSDGAIANAHSACDPMTWAGHSRPIISQNRGRLNVLDTQDPLDDRSC
jgi:hypothetical protein